MKKTPPMTIIPTTARASAALIPTRRGKPQAAAAAGREEGTCCPVQGPHSRSDRGQ